jgi:hypothetical protein
MEVWVLGKSVGPALDSDCSGISSGGGDGD